MKRTAIITASLFPLVLAACDGGTDPMVEDPWVDAPYDVVACVAMAPATGAAVPLDDVPLGQVPSVLEPPLLARVESPATGAHGYAAVLLDGGTATLLAPLHPDGSPTGGQVRVWVSDGARSCEPFDFSVLPLPPAPGELAAVASLLQEMTDVQAALMGTSREALQTTPIQDQPLPLLPLAVKQDLLDHPQNPWSVMAIARGSAPDSGRVRLDLLDPLLARTGLREALEAALAPVRPSAALADPPGAALTDGQLYTICTPEGVGTNAGLLDRCMDAAAEAQFEIKGASGEVLRDLAIVFAATGMVPGMELVSAHAGLLAWCALYDKLEPAATFPSVLAGLTLKADPVLFNEDKEGLGSWDAEVGAWSLGFDFGKPFIEYLLQLTKISGALEKLGGGGDKVTAVLAAIARGPGVKVLIGDGTLEAFQEPPQFFGPVDVTPEQWSESRIASGDAVARLSHREYEPRKPGTAVLAVRTKVGAFAGQSAAADQDVTVREIQLGITPDEVTLAPKQEQTFTVTVTNSDYPWELEVDPEVVLQGTASLTWDGGGSHTVVYTAPDTPDPSKPDLLTVKHTASTGARGFAAADLTAVATIRFGGVEITTEPTCLEPGDSLWIEVKTTGFPFTPELIFSTDAGTITQAGLFVAPGDATQAKVTVALADNPQVNDFIYLQIGACSCSAVLNLAGNAPPAERLTFYLTEDLSAVREVAWGGSLSSASFTFGSTPGAEEPVTVGVTGGFPVVGGGYVDGAGTFGNLGNQAIPPMAPLNATVEENDGGNLFTGFINGWVQLQDQENPVSFSLVFRIAADPAFSTATERRCYVTP